jgi:hypothetical protein
MYASEKHHKAGKRHVEGKEERLGSTMAKKKGQLVSRRHRITGA